MNIKKIKANGVAIFDKMRKKDSFSDEQRHKYEQMYKQICSKKISALSK